MITSDGRGFLIDWDLAKDINSEGARSLGRTVRTRGNDVCNYTDIVSIGNSSVYIRKTAGKSRLEDTRVL
jgi:hypothetical protein